VINALLEADRVVLEAGTPNVVLTPSNSGKGQKISRCPSCCVALWSNYAGGGDAFRFVRVGTLDEPDRLPPDIHSSRRRNSPGSCCPRACRRCPSITTRRNTGRRRASSAGASRAGAELIGQGSFGRAAS
jgi:hypothetical protein